MTLTEFKSLKVGDRVCIPRGKRSPKELMGTEVLGVDHLFRKVTVLCGGDKPLSYRYVRKQPNKGWTITSAVGMCKRTVTGGWDI